MKSDFIKFVAIGAGVAVGFWLASLAIGTIKKAV